MDGCIIVVEDLTEEKLEYEAPLNLLKKIIMVLLVYRL